MFRLIASSILYKRVLFDLEPVVGRVPPPSCRFAAARRSEAGLIRPVRTDNAAAAAALQRYQ